MTTTTTVYPDADLAHPGELSQPLSVDGSGYTEPSILGIDTAAYQGGDSNADGMNSSVLVLPEIEGVAAAGDIELMVSQVWSGEALFSGSLTPAGTTITFDVPTVDRNGAAFALAADDLIEIEVFTLTTAASAPSVPGCAGLSLTWNERFHNPIVTDYRPQVSKFWAQAAGSESGTMTVTWGSSWRRSGRMKIWRGVDPAAPYAITTWTSGQIVLGYSYPDAPAVTNSVEGATVYMTAGGDAVSAGYTIPVAPSGWPEVLNSAKLNSGYRNPQVSAMLQDQAAGSFNPPAMTGLNFSNEYAAIDVLRPAATSEVPVVVFVAVSDETATAALATGDVALAALNEVQLLTAFSGSGSRTLTFSGQTTGSIADTASAATIQTALEALSNIAPGDVVVTGGPLQTAPIRVEFDATYALTDVAEITVSGSNTDPVNEVQSVQSTKTSGTFPLVFGGQTAADLPYNLTAAQLETALEALSTVGLNNVVVTGGPLPGSSLLVEFVGALAGADQSLMTSADGAIGITEVAAGVAGAGMVVDTVVVGSAGEDFTLESSFNIPRDNTYEPQWHVFRHLISGYTAGSAIDVRVSDHDGNHSWAAVLVVLDPSKSDTADLIEALGSEVSDGSGSNATYGSVTPVTSGAKVLAVLAKAKAGAQIIGVPSAGTAPAGYTVAAEALGDAMTMGVFSSPPVAAAAASAGSSSWTGGDQAWSTILVALKPLVGSSAGSALWSVIDDEGTTDWIDIASAAGSMFEIVEVDLDGIPADAVITGARIELAHSSSVPNQLRAALVGIDSGGGVHLAAEQQVGYTPQSGGGVTTVVSNFWTTLADGTSLNDYDRFGIALISSSRHPALSNHRIYWARVTVRYEEGGPVVSNVVGPDDPGDPITWDYSSAGGFAQTYYEVLVVQGSSQDPDAATAPADPLGPATGEIVFGSGRVPGSLVRSLSLTAAPLGRGACTVAVRAWSSITSSLLVASAWSVDNFDVSGAPATTPDQSGTEPVYGPATGAVTVAAVAPAAVSRAWLERSTDGGATWELTEGSPFVVTPSSSNDLDDVYAPAAETVSYAVAFDDGAMTETSAPDQIGTAGVDTTPVAWLFVVPSDPALSTQVEVSAISEIDPVPSVAAFEPGGGLVTSGERLGKVMTMTLRTRSKAERLAVEAVIFSGLTIRVVGILGEAWLMRLSSDRQRQLQRWRPTAAESTGLRDAFEHSFTLVEVAE
jgi:hypothetical protein